MKKRYSLVALLAALGGGVSAEPPVRAQVSQEPKAAESSDAPKAHRTAQVCFGGAENGKVVVSKGQVEDSVVQTTLEGCRIGGGAHARAPQSPLLAARRFATTA